MNNLSYMFMSYYKTFVIDSNIEKVDITKQFFSLDRNLSWGRP